MKQDGLSIVLPVFNEEGNIKNVLIDIIVNLHVYIEDFEIIVVDDGSTDRSLNILNHLNLKYPQLKLIRNYKNEGYGAAIRKGIRNAQKEWLLIMDSDGQFRIDDFKSFWDERLSYDFIIGYRKKEMIMYIERFWEK